VSGSPYVSYGSKSAVGALLRHVRLAAVSGLHLGIAACRGSANKRHLMRSRLSARATAPGIGMESYPTDDGTAR
jgi:hypothetical protein